MALQFSGFDWDSGNRSKCQRHGVTLEEIEDLFRRPIAVLPDPEHSQTEERFKAIGKTAKRRHVFLTFTFRHRGDMTLIRPISARYMHRREIEHYEKETAQAPDR
jgi:uncharacterized DUF497 family protein